MPRFQGTWSPCLGGLLLVFIVTVSSSRVSPVSKVIELLDELSAKAKEDGDAGTRIFQEFTRYCENTHNENDRAIKAATIQITELQADIGDAQATIQQLSAEISETASKISDNEAEFKEAAAIRSSEHAEFLKSDTELSNTIDSLARAISVLSRKSKGASLLQQRTVQQDFLKVAQSLRSIVEASFVESNQRQVVEAFLQQREDQEEDEFSLQPQAAVSAYSTHGSGIIDTLSDLQDKAETSQASLRKEEMSAKHAFEMMHQATVQEKKALNSKLEDATNLRSSKVELESKSKGELINVQKTKSVDQRFLEGLKMTCQNKAQAYEEETASRKGELEAIAKAKAILQENVAPSFLQTGLRARVHARARSRARTLARARVRARLGLKTRVTAGERSLSAAQYLRSLSRRLGSRALGQVALRLSQDKFGKVRSMIEAMIEKLLEEASQETDHKSWCDKELAEATVAKESKEAKKAEADTRIEKARAELEKLGDDIRQLTAETGEIDAQIAEATKIRSEEKALFTKDLEDAEQSQQACASAISVLRSYYEGGSFVQAGAGDGVVQDDSVSLLQLRARAGTRSFGQQPQGSGASNIIGLLEVAESDFSTAAAEMRSTEHQAQQEYQVMMQENAVAKAAKKAEANANESEAKRIESRVGELGADQSGLAQELESVVKYGALLKPECQTNAPGYAERSERRKQEIEGLQSTLAILEGRDLATPSDGASALVQLPRVGW